MSDSKNLTDRIKELSAKPTQSTSKVNMNVSKKPPNISKAVHLDRRYVNFSEVPPAVNLKTRTVTESTLSNSESKKSLNEKKSTKKTD